MTSLSDQSQAALAASLDPSQAPPPSSPPGPQQEPGGPGRRALTRVLGALPPPVLVLAAILSIQVGAAVAIHLFPTLGPSGTGWNASGMHHLDAHSRDDESWIACVDGWTASTS